MALHRSQSVMLPQSHHSLGGIFYDDGLVNPQIGVPNAQFARATRDTTKAANQMIDPFFDESANELSSIE